MHSVLRNLSPVNTRPRLAAGLLAPLFGEVQKLHGVAKCAIHNAPQLHFTWIHGDDRIAAAIDRY
ncbi:MAG: hypothetical protein ACRD4I_17010, partial [Candidatus Angelobacter sp.]